MLPLLVAVTVRSAPVGQAFAGIEGQRLRFAFEEAAHRSRQDETVIGQCFRERLQRAIGTAPTPGIAAYRIAPRKM